LHTGIDYKDKTKNILKSLIMVISADLTWWDAKSEKIQRYSVCKIGNELSRGINNEQAERIVINSDEFHRRATIAQYAHHGIKMIPYTKVDRSKKMGCLMLMSKRIWGGNLLHWTLPCAQPNHPVRDLHLISDLKVVLTILANYHQ
jgi:hypothetical protein